jgi:hypothetical protein
LSEKTFHSWRKRNGQREERKNRRVPLRGDLSVGGKRPPPVLGEKERILRELVSKEWEIPFSTRTYISKATILAWVKRYEDGGRKIEALFPERRGDKGRMRSITDEQIDALMQLRNEHPKLSTPRLVEIAQGNGVFPAGKRFPWPAFTGS